MKTCSMCWIEKEQSEFYRDKQCKSGFRKECKKCAYKRKEISYLRNRDKICAYKREWSKNNPLSEAQKIRKKELHAIWISENHEHVKKKGREASKKWRENNRERQAFFCKRYASNNRESIRDNWIRWKERNPEKYKAQSSLQNAVKYGKIMRPNECSKCFVKCKPEGHHQDYLKPLEVIWLCKQCHEEVHHGG